MRMAAEFGVGDPLRVCLAMQTFEVEVEELPDLQGKR